MNEKNKEISYEEKAKKFERFLIVENKYFDLLGLNNKKLRDALRTIIESYLVSHDLMT